MKKLYFSIVGLFFVLATIIAVSYAWFVNSSLKTPDVTGYSASAYFAGGNGTETDPYIINNSRHLYNLAWLQYLGQFNQTTDAEGKELTKQYHFKIEATEINMDGVALPPIGTEDKPFMGVLEGGNCVIKNLKVSNDLTNDLTKHPNSLEVTSDKIKNIKVLGMFGVIGNYNEKYTNIASSVRAGVKNLTLDNISVSTISNETLIGLLAGFVAQSGDVEKIGIHYSSIKLSTGVSKYVTDNISNYGLIGDYDSEYIEWEDKPSSGGPGYGASTDLGHLWSVYGKNGIEKGMAFPFQAETTDVIVPSSETKPMNLSSGSKSVTVATTQAATTSNIGYYVGSDVKFYNKEVQYKDFYYPNHSSGSYLLPYTSGSTTYNAPSQDIIDYLNSAKGQYQMRLTGTEIDINNEGGLVVVENGKVGDYSGDVLVPRRCVWVAPRQAGTLKFVFPNVENSAMGLRINRLTRSKPKDYSSYISNSSQILEFNAVLLGSYVYYFEIEVTQEDVDAGYEYAITGGNQYKTYASYVDIGAAGGSSTPTYTGTINGVDFIYETGGSLVDIASADYIKSNVAFAISGTSGADGVYIYFKRKNELDLAAVLYFVSGSGIEITPIGTGNSSSATDENCDSIAGA